MVVESPDLLQKFVAYWQKHLPDMSDFPKLESSQLQFWLKKNKTKRAAKPHSMLKGVAGLRLNAAIDFALQHNTWCVCFRDKNSNLVDLVKAAILKVWVHYSCGMVRKCLSVRVGVIHVHACTQPGRPMPSSNACQLVLKYFLINEKDFKKAFQNRLYYYSSGSVFSKIAEPIDSWIAFQENTSDEDSTQPEVPVHVDVHIHT